MMSLALEDDLPDLAPTRPIWLMTLADLALLLVGFFVLLQASQQIDRAALARGLRAGFGVRDVVAPSSVPTPEPMAVSAGAIRGFAPGSAVLPTAPDALIGWAREATRDRRVLLRVAGAVDGSPGDVDPVTGSGAVLAADRARAVASALLLAHAVPANRITIVAAARPGRDIAFPVSVVEMLRGDLGQPPGGWPADIQMRVLGNEPVITVRPASLLGEQDLSASRQEAEDHCGRRLTETEFTSYLMYPKVFAGFAESSRRYGPVSALPTAIYFYGMEAGQEIEVEIERGKTLVITLTAIGETGGDGSVRVFFELNGQPRIISVADRKRGSAKTARREADPANERHIAAPMPGLVAMIAVADGQSVKTGDLLMTLEAMKMETAITAPRDATIAELCVRVGQAIDSKDLLAVLA